MVGRPREETLVGLSFCIAAGAPTGSPPQAYCRIHLPEKTGKRLDWHLARKETETGVN